jgi:hypothetical protein
VPGLFGEIRAACAEVARRARHVRIDAERGDALALELVGGAVDDDLHDPAHHRVGDDADTLAFVIALDAVNFGSGWFPLLRKRAGLSGYFTLAGGLRDYFERCGRLSPAQLASASPELCAKIFGQDLATPEIARLMGHFARSWRDLGDLLQGRYAGDFARLVASAGGNAEALVRTLAQMPLYRDVARYEELEVPLYKRAQITVVDLATSFGGRGPGAFHDLDELTLFADNLVPHVLRMEGVLRYDADLCARIDAGTLIDPGSPEEVELRACALHAVEGMCDGLRARGHVVSAHVLDQRLWSRGQRPSIKAVPRHRARSVYY